MSLGQTNSTLRSKNTLAKNASRDRLARRARPLLIGESREGRDEEDRQRAHANLPVTNAALLDCPAPPQPTLGNLLHGGFAKGRISKSEMEARWLALSRTGNNAADELPPQLASADDLARARDLERSRAANSVSSDEEIQERAIDRHISALLIGLYARRLELLDSERELLACKLPGAARVPPLYD
jgi:hypothetical protein